MVDCNIIGWANIILVFHLCLLIVVQPQGSSAQTVAPNNVTNGTDDDSMTLIVSNGTSNANVTSVRDRKMITMLPRKKVVAVAVAYRFNILLVGGSFNMLISLLNLIIALLNFYLLIGKYDTTLRLTVGKLNHALQEMSTRDLHPKIKMSFHRRMMPDSPFFPQVLQRLKEPSPMFDSSNHLLDGQKEARLRKVHDLEQKEKEEKGKSGKGKSAKTPAASSGKSASKPTSSANQKNK